MSLSGFTRCSAIAALALLADGAFAQPLKEVLADNLIRLYPGEARTFEFTEPVDRIGTAVEGIAQILPHTDRNFTLQAITPGKVLAEAFAKDGRLIHRMLIVVEGNLVRVHRGPDAGNTTSYSCTDIGGCDPTGPAPAPTPSQPSAVTEPERNGGSGIDQTNP